MKLIDMLLKQHRGSFVGCDGCPRVNDLRVGRYTPKDPTKIYLTPEGVFVTPPCACCPRLARAPHRGGDT